MPRLDHAAFETDDPRATAAFYERILGAHVVEAEGHPVMAYVGNTGFAFHERGGPGDHVGVRVSEAERAEIKRRLDEAGIQNEERDHEIAIGLSSRIPTAGCSRRSRTARAKTRATPDRLRHDAAL